MKLANWAAATLVLSPLILAVLGWLIGFLGEIHCAKRGWQMNKYASWEASEHSHHDPLALVTALIRDRDQISLTLAVAKADRDKWFNRAKALDVDKADLLRVLGVADVRVKALEADLREAKQYGALIDRVEQYAAGNVTGCGTCTTIINEIRSFELETKPAPGFCSECLMTGGHKLSCSKVETK